MKTFKDYLTENHNESVDIQNLLNESYDLTEEQETAIDNAVDRIMEEHNNGKDLEVIMEEIINEGILGSVLGGLTAFCLSVAVLILFKFSVEFP